MSRSSVLLKEGEFAPQSMLDKAQDNAIKEHAQALAYMKGDMAEGVAEIVFAEKDLPHLRSIKTSPEIILKNIFFVLFCIIASSFLFFMLSLSPSYFFERFPHLCLLIIQFNPISGSVR